MQRRIAIALGLTALVSILLVGLGVLAISQLGARDRAASEVNRSLNIVDAALESTPRGVSQLELLAAANRQDLRLRILAPVQVDDDGRVEAIDGFRRGRPGPSTENLPEIRLSADQLVTLDAGQTVVVDQRGLVLGLRTPGTDRLLDRDGNRIAVLAGQEVRAAPRETVLWFALSSALVLIGAIMAGVWLARRLARPIRTIEDTTAAIAAGDLAARVTIDGGRPSDELVSLGHSVNRMAADLERSRALDRQFLMSVSHDLRTPLTAISGYAEALRDGAVDEPKMAGEIIGNHAGRLDRLVGDLLDLAKLDANRFQLNLRPVDLAVVAGRTAAGLAPQADQHGVHIETTMRAAPVVVADADRLAQAIGNVITNAVSFARQQVTVEVDTELSTAPDPASQVGWATVSISDDGPGFAAEDLPFVFDRLYTGSARPRQAENSSGLGLAIVRELSAAMDGQVEAGNEPEGGARITLRLPLRGEETDAVPVVEPGQVERDEIGQVGNGEAAATTPETPSTSRSTGGSTDRLR